MYCQLGHWEQISVKFQTKRIFIQETEFEKVNIKMVAILSLPQHVDQIILLFDNCTQYHDIDLNKWQKCAWFSIAHFLIEYGTQDVNKGCKVLHACESQGLTLRTFYQNHCRWRHSWAWRHHCRNNRINHNIATKWISLHLSLHLLWYHKFTSIS